jgi:hypothetical protein
MVWVPTKGQRATVRARFADLMKESDLVSMPPFRVKMQSGQMATSTAESTAIESDALNASQPLPSHANVGAATNVEKTTTRRTKNRSLRQTDVWDRHHIPPKHPCKYIIKRVKRSHHEAFNLLFGSSGSFEECVAILKEHWWPDLPQ